MADSLFVDALKLKGDFFPDWEGVPEHIWHTLLNEYFFIICDSFGFQNVLETKDLFPHNLSFFSDWDLKEIDLVEFENEILCRFELNQTCKIKLVEAEFAVHAKGMSPPRHYRDFDNHHYYHEFDELYFFQKERLVGYYVHHESMMGFINYEPDIKLLLSLDEPVKKYIVESMRIEQEFKRYFQ